MAKENDYDYMRRELDKLEAAGNLRRLPRLEHDGRFVTADGRRMLNLSSNDYLGLAADIGLRSEFLSRLTPEAFVPSSSSSRLLTGNCPVYEELEAELARLYGREAALVLNCGYHANTGILPAVADADTLILADKLVHASLIDGLKLGTARYLRYRHNDMKHLERMLHEYAPTRKRTVIVTESIFSMDGDEAPLRQLVELKKRYPGTLLYVDEAHAFGVRGRRGLGCAEEQGVTADIDFLMGTFGKAAGSEGAFVVCGRTVREWLVNRMRPFIFTTALPPVSVAWTLFVLRRLVKMDKRRKRLAELSTRLHRALHEWGMPDLSSSHIVPLIVGESAETVLKAEALQRHGFYLTAVRPPTVPEGTSRLRLSLRADMTDEEMESLIQHLKDL